MLHHISIGVSNIEISGAFYDAVLAPLGFVRVFDDLRPGERHQAIGYGNEPGEDKFTLKERFADDLAPRLGFHLAFSAPSREAVDEWHQRGLEGGATDRGAPKVWTEFGPRYYAAYLTDPDGWQIEATFSGE